MRTVVVVGFGSGVDTVWVVMVVLGVEGRERRQGSVHCGICCWW